jgi:large subunit ribosomal protein L25
VKVKGTPTSLPEFFEIDVTHLSMGQTLLVRDIVAPEGVEVLTDSSNAVVSISRPRVVEEETVSEEDEALIEGEGGAEGDSSTEEGKDESSGGEGDK